MIPHDFLYFCFWYPGDKPDDATLAHPEPAGWLMALVCVGVYAESQRITPDVTCRMILARCRYFEEFCRTLADGE